MLPDPRTKEQAVADGYAGYNNGPHFTLDIPEGHSTLSLALPNGQRMTIAFIPYSHTGSEKPVTMDLALHNTGHHVANGDSQVPTMKMRALGCGPTNFVSNHNDENPTTIVSVDLSTE